MKAIKQSHKDSEKETNIYKLFDEFFQERINEEKREKQTLVDKFNIHLKGKEIVLDNTNS